jgi:hypothetical protein
MADIMVFPTPVSVPVMNMRGGHLIELKVIRTTV